MLDALDHVIVAVRDLDAARASYSRLLGLAPSWAGVHPGSGTANVLFRLDNTYLELLSPAGASGVPGEGLEGALLSGWLDERGEGLLGLAFATSSAVRCRAAFEGRGLTPGELLEGHGVDSATGARREWARVPLPFDRTRGVMLFAIEHRSDRDALPRDAAATASSVYALDHAVVQTRDAEAAIALYGRDLGLRLALDRRFEDWGVRLLFFRVGGVTVEVACALGDDEPRADEIPNAAVDRLWGLSYRVGDIEAAAARLTAAGFDVSDVRKGRRPRTRVLTVRSGTHGVPTLLLEVESD